ncbi:PRC-barrel domain-containing protein [Arthrobacter oryzae]|uniref:PRC-barrel domain protein n=1 Tax=Arthrobacter oryzae TaxID=409290 RepID=A0A495FLU1_9MICC|nr:PRC-barrel domain-containing protein [Arthrobacter oryzae]RKR30195.1 PRC-barrel domain protein [Arthrobacter oryzae]
MTLDQPEPVEISTRVRPGEWTEDTLSSLVASFRDELLRMGAPPEEITVATERDDGGGVSIVATWNRPAGENTEAALDLETPASAPTPGNEPTAAAGTRNPPYGIQGTTVMLNREDIDGLIQSKGNVISVDGDTIGGIGQIYVDDATDRPSWATVATGLFGSHESFFPLDGARIDGSNLVIPYNKALVKDAPRIEPEGGLEPDEQDRLYRHYQRDGGLQTYSEAQGMTGSNPGADVPAGSGSPNAGPGRLRRYGAAPGLPSRIPGNREHPEADQ